jgi:hypothetical protein
MQSFERSLTRPRAIATSAGTQSFSGSGAGHRNLAVTGKLTTSSNDIKAGPRARRIASPLARGATDGVGIGPETGCVRYSCSACSLRMRSSSVRRLVSSWRNSARGDLPKMSCGESARNIERGLKSISLLQLSRLARRLTASEFRSEGREIMRIRSGDEVVLAEADKLELGS